MLGSDHRQSTNDAYVTADYTVVAPKVPGFIKEVLVEDNQQVSAGQLLATIDDRDYRAALDAAQAQLLVAKAQSADARATLERQASLIAQAEAAVKAAQAEMAFADHEVTRYSRLAEQGAGTVQNAQQARSRVEQARARLANAQAALVATRKQVDILTAQVASAEGQLKRAEAGVEKAQLICPTPASPRRWMAWSASVPCASVRTSIRARVCSRWCRCSRPTWWATSRKPSSLTCSRASR